MCPRIGGRRDRPNSPRHRLLQLSGIEDIVSSVLDRREERGNDEPARLITHCRGLHAWAPSRV
jgi:hypothetical protein